MGSHDIDELYCMHEHFWVFINTVLFEVIVGVLTTCHTQYTW